MALEANLIINAKDNAGAAFNALKAQIDIVEKQIAGLERLAKQVGNVGPGADKLARSINEMSAAMKEQRDAALELASGLEATEGAAGSAAAGQARLRAAILETNRVLALQGGVAEREAGKIRAIGQKQAKESAATRKEMVGIGGGIVGTMLGFGAAELGVKGIEAGATLDQALARLGTTGAKPDEIAKARGGYQDFAKDHGGMAEAEFLTLYGEARTMSSDPLKTVREMALFSTALKNSGVQTTDEEVRSFVKSMDELSLTPENQEKMLDRMVKIKQLYGNNITGETFLAAQRRSSMSAYGWDQTFRENYFPFMLQSLGVSGGNDMMTAYSNFIGGHMQHSELKNLAKYGFVNPNDIIYNRVGDIKGLRPGAEPWEADVMKRNPAQWSWDMHQRFLSRKGATEDQWTTFVGSLPRAMGAMIEFFTHGEGLAARDMALGKNPVGMVAAGNEYLAQNPIAALGALRAAVEQFGAALTSAPVQQAGAQLVALSKHITEAAGAVANFEKGHPGTTKAVTWGAEGVGGALGLGLLAAGGKWLVRTALNGFGLGGLLGGGTAAAGGGVAASPALRASTGVLGRLGLGAVASSPLMDIMGPVLLMRELGELANPTTPAGARYRTDTAWPSQVWDLERAQRAEREWRADPEAARGRAMMAHASGFSAASASVSVSGQARVDQQLTIRVEPSPLLNAIVDQARQQSETTVPLIGGGGGRMDSDAGPHRGAGIGRM